MLPAFINMLGAKGPVRQWLRLICVPGLLLPLVSLMPIGCATTGDIESLKSNTEVQRLNDEKEIAQLKTAVSELQQNTVMLKEQGVGALKESQSSLLSQVSDLSKAIQVLEGRFDENKYFIDKTMKELLAEKDLQQARIAALENDVKDLKSKIQQPQTTATLPPGQAQTGASPAPAGEQPASAQTPAYDAPQKLYDDAQIDFKGKHYEESRQKFEKITTDFPTHTLVSSAYFWIGETYYMQKKYEDAILAYENFLKKYPSNDKARGAMLKQAYSFINIGDKKTGKVILERVIQKYPRSNEAELAEKKLAEILHSGTKKSKKKKKTAD